ncbi:peptidase inhibitor family I36 protein [Streptomyces sp. NPDC050508]|uniref:peptidase inhibitor family I36 protein n=1 Tax=Streptomyces sp. NPDC050508 TaxID=3155405 RepID=UPI0034447B6F
MKRKIALSLGLLALCTASTIGVASTASADESGVQASYFVLYENENYGGHDASFSGTDRELNNKYWAGTTTIMNNKASSMRNNTSSYVGMWTIGGDCTGENYTAKPNSVDSKLGDFNDNASCVIFL